MQPVFQEDYSSNQETGLELPESLLYDRRFLFNRELSWLEFNRRVLEEAADKSQPLLERLKFLAIFSTNLDEFFMIRVSGLKEQMAENISERSPDGMTAAEQLREIRACLLPMLDEQLRCLREEVLRELSNEGITIWAYNALTDEEKHEVNLYFMENVFPVLTPQAVDASHPFPHISNLSLNLSMMIEPNGHGFRFRYQPDEPRFARIKVPPNLKRLVPVGNSGTKFTLLGELIAANVNALFPGMKVSNCYLFRVTRDADIEIREDEAGDLMRTLEQELRRKRGRSAVRLEVAGTMPDEMVKFLTKSIGLHESDVYRVDGILDIPALMQLYGLDLPHLKDKPLPTTTPKALKSDKRIWEILKQQDILVHHPFTSYSAITDFINAAAVDEHVQAIKICLYRTGKDSPIVKALMRASDNGKQVAALVELKARFDEENNIEWARKLENTGVHVVYGMRGLKTHCKLALVVRREGERLKRYVHLATGNYNPTTSRIYTDLGLLTADEEIGADATDVFNYLTGYSNQTEYRRLMVAPINLREKLTSLVRREIEHQQNGRGGRIILKMNSLTDVEIVHVLYQAAQAGVEIDLIVRGICVLRPAVAGLSENIRVRSIVGRFLEHSRIFYFANAGQPEVFIGSADWMQRNLDRRVEIITPIKDAAISSYIRETILESYLRDNVKARRLMPDGSYWRIHADGEEFNSQNSFIGIDS
jgi:polyphosphate kinase